MTSRDILIKCQMIFNSKCLNYNNKITKFIYRQTVRREEVLSVLITKDKDGSVPKERC